MLFFQPTFILIVFIVVRCTDLAITYGMSHSPIRSIAYGIVAILALVALILLIGVH